MGQKKTENGDNEKAYDRQMCEGGGISLRRIIEFMRDYEAKHPKKPAATHRSTNRPVKSLVKVRFVHRHQHLTYYNDQFNLKEGDVVYVSGKLAGEPGVVTLITTKFCTHTHYFERVLSRLDLTIHGSFTQVGDNMVSFPEIAITPDQFDGWITPPADPLQEGEEDEIIAGEGFTVDINQLECCQEITDAVASRAIDCCEDGRVRYLCIQNGVGRAYVQGQKWYRVDFCFAEGVMTDIYCNCPYPELCKHETAVALTLWKLYQRAEFCEVRDFMAMDRSTFWKLAALKKHIDL